MGNGGLLRNPIFGKNRISLKLLPITYYVAKKPIFGKHRVFKIFIYKKWILELNEGDAVEYQLLNFGVQQQF